MTSNEFLQGSASESCLTVCIAARERYLRMHPTTPSSELVILATSQTHSLAAKAALILGLDFHAVETRKENDWALRGSDLEEALAELQSKGKKPFILSAFPEQLAETCKRVLTSSSGQSPRWDRPARAPSTRLLKSLPSVSGPGGKAIPRSAEPRD